MEFALKTRMPSRDLFDRLADRGIFAGVPTSRFLWQDDYLIVCATEKRTREEMDFYGESLKEVIS
jgi:glycine dehydrogenase subunit 1